MLRIVLEEIFAKNGFQVILASSASEATKLLETERIDLITLDLQMPEKDGLTWLKEQRLRRMNQPVLIVTAAHTSDAADVLSVLESGQAQHFLNKSELKTNERGVIDIVKAIIVKKKN